MQTLGKGAAAFARRILVGQLVSFQALDHLAQGCSEMWINPPKPCSNPRTLRQRWPVQSTGPSDGRAGAILWRQIFTCCSSSQTRDNV
jgi:hypothetical protein